MAGCFVGRSGSHRAIQSLSNSPVNHVGMTVAIEDLRPLMWPAELGEKLIDVWTVTNHRGVQLDGAGKTCRAVRCSSMDSDARCAS